MKNKHHFRFMGDDELFVVFKADNYINAIRILDELINLGYEYSFSEVYYNLNTFSSLSFEELELDVKEMLLSDDSYGVFKNRNTNNIFVKFNNENIQEFIKD